MNKYSSREIAELVGIFSIVAGLMLVAYELRQNSQLMRAQVFNVRTRQPAVSVAICRRSL